MISVAPLDAGATAYVAKQTGSFTCVHFGHSAQGRWAAIAVLVALGVGYWIDFD